MNIIRFRWRYSVLFTILLVVMLLLACDINTSGYFKYIQKEGVARFSFEYPESYEEGTTSVDIDYIWVTRLFWENNEWLVSSLRVRVIKTGWGGYSDATKLVEEEYKMFFDSVNDYQVLERSQVSIDGIQSELITSSYYIEDLFDSDLKEPTTIIRRDVYFDHNGFIWEITMQSIEKVAEADEPIWDHLLETFKILD